MANTSEFTNNSGKTVMVLSGESESSTSPKQGYEATLTTLTFEGGGTTLDTGKTSQLNLPPKDTHPISNLLISDPATLAPILAVGEGPDFSKPPDFPNKPITVTTDDVTAMSQALTFRQNIMASPSSKLAVAFQEALKEAQAEKTADKMLSDMATFFQGQKGYEKVTYPAYSAIESYLKTYALSWVQKNSASGSNSGATYYVYSAPEASKKGATSEGTIQATKKSGNSGSADPSDNLSGYTISLSSDDSNVPLSYSGGVFEDSSGGAVQLAATYAYQGRFTGKVSEVQLWPVLAGTIQSKQILAIPLSPESAWSKFWSSLTFGKVFKYFMEAMGLWMALDFLKTKLSSKEKSLEEDKAENNGDDPTPEQEQQADTDADTAGSADASTSTEQGQSVSGDSSFDVPTSDSAISDQVSTTRTASSDALNDVAKDQIDGSIEQTGNTLEDVAAIEVTPATEKAGTDLMEASKEAEAGNISGANDSIQSANTELNTAVKELGDTITEQQKEAFEADIEAAKEASEEAKETDEEGDNAGEGEDPEGDGFPLEE